MKITIVDGDLMEKEITMIIFIRTEWGKDGD